MKDIQTLGSAERDRHFAALVDRHARFLYRIAFSVTGHRQEAEDTVQDTLLKLYRTDAWQHMLDEQAYLARAVWRAGLDRRGTAHARHMRHAEDAAELDLTSSAASPEDAMLAASERALLRDLIDELPERLRQPLLLSAIEGMRSADVATVLDIPDATVRTRIHAAKAELRKRFAALGVRTSTPQEVRP